MIEVDVNLVSHRRYVSDAFNVLEYLKSGQIPSYFDITNNATPIQSRAIENLVHYCPNLRYNPRIALLFGEVFRKASLPLLINYPPRPTSLNSLHHHISPENINPLPCLTTTTNIFGPTGTPSWRSSTSNAFNTSSAVFRFTGNSAERYTVASSPKQVRIKRHAIEDNGNIIRRL
ncbi:hypothetical protein [Burkholderia sp. HI2500]|uniref:hypothetical protein n=1 Tax=Burkholderia sp. HI2500 TaxID=2015358 RepID=UPI00211B3B64|nr:hypothetical protein [Burkholderia sp. HI2500]